MEKEKSGGFFVYTFFLFFFYFGFSVLLLSLSHYFILCNGFLSYISTYLTYVLNVIIEAVKQQFDQMQSDVYCCYAIMPDTPMDRCLSRKTD